MGKPGNRCLDGRGGVYPWSWEVDAVRQRLGLADDMAWFETVISLQAPGAGTEDISPPTRKAQVLMSY
jgi:hypothetical protein